jgi:hypothetical protein
MGGLINAIMGIILGAILSFTAGLYFFKKKTQIREAELIARGHKELSDRVDTGYEKLSDRMAKVEASLSMVNQAILPMSTAFQAILVKELTHFHTPAVDALLKKLGPPLTITEAEMETLQCELRHRISESDPLVTRAEREAAIMLPYVIRRVARERDGLVPLAGKQIQLVSVSGDSPDTTGQTAP